MHSIAKTFLLFFAAIMLSNLGAQDIETQDRSSDATLQERRVAIDDFNSPDPDVRRASLNALVTEIKTGVDPADGQYTRFGNAILPALHRAILEADDPTVKYAVDAIFWLGTIEQLRTKAVASSAPDLTVTEQSQYPVPSEHPPLKDALINVLNNSQDSDARYGAALALADGFTPVSEIEDALVRQLPLEDSSWKVQSAIMGSLSELADSNSLKPATQRAVIDALKSANTKTRQTALQILIRHRFDGALDALTRDLSVIENSYELSQRVAAIPRFAPLDESEIGTIQSRLRGFVASIDNAQIRDELNKSVEAILDTLRFANSDRDHRFGMIQSGLNSIFLHTPNRGLITGTQIGVVGSDMQFFVMRKAETEKESWIQLQTSATPLVTYDIAPDRLKVDPEEINGRIGFIGESGPADSLSHSQCSSEEGIHHSVWSTENAEKSRVWSAYQYVGYALEANCTDSELADL